MASAVTTNSLLEHLPEAERELVEALMDKMRADEKVLEKVRAFLEPYLIGAHTVDLKVVAEDLQLEACVDSLIIGLMSGDIKKTKIVQLCKNV